MTSIVKRESAPTVQASGLGGAVGGVGAVDLEAHHDFPTAALAHRFEDLERRENLVEGHLARIGAKEADDAGHIGEQQREAPTHDHTALIGGETGTVGATLTEADWL